MSTRSHRFRWSHILGCAVLLALVLACAAEVPAPPDVLLLVVDTLRADRLGVYGYDRRTSPELDAFAREALVFAPVVAPASWTLPSVGSLFTSTYPPVHGLRARSGERNVAAVASNAGRCSDHRAGVVAPSI